ncbi:MAG: SHOCT domain-containing protein, partial [Haloechinothrix sp.]
MHSNRQGPSADMSWQEELRQLDLQHSQGLLTEQQYRAKREDLLAEASCAPSVRPLRNTPADSSPATRQGRPSAADLLATRLPTTAPSPADERPTDRIAPPPRPARRATRPVATPVPPPPPVPAAPGFPPPGQPHRIGVPKRTQPPWLVVMLGVFVVLTLIIGAMWWIGTLYHGQPSAPAT